MRDGTAILLASAAQECEVLLTVPLFNFPKKDIWMAAPHLPLPVKRRYTTGRNTSRLTFTTDRRRAWMVDAEKTFESPSLDYLCRLLGSPKKCVALKSTGSLPIIPLSLTTPDSFSVP